MDHRGHNQDSWRIKGARFVQYLTTRDKECWGFFIAGILVAIVFA